MKAFPTTKEDAEWFSEKTSCYPESELKGVKFLDSEDNLAAMVVYTDWTLNAVQIHFAAPSMKFFADKTAVREVFDFPYRMGRKIVYAATPSDRVPALAILRLLGFTEKFRFEHGWKEGVDMVFHVMDLESCKWRAH